MEVEFAGILKTAINQISLITQTQTGLAQSKFPPTEAQSQLSLMLSSPQMRGNGILSHFTHGEPGALQKTHRAEVQVQEAVIAIAEEK